MLFTGNQSKQQIPREQLQFSLSSEYDYQTAASVCNDGKYNGDE